jgi:MFS family permease
MQTKTKRQNLAQSKNMTENTVLALSVLIALMFSKFFYIASLTNYYTFYLIGKYHLPVQGAQLFLFLFLFAVAAGTMIGGHLGDQFGRKYVIWVSILGVARRNSMLAQTGAPLSGSAPRRGFFCGYGFAAPRPRRIGTPCAFSPESEKCGLGLTSGIFP